MFSCSEFNFEYIFIDEKLFNSVIMTIMLIFSALIDWFSRSWIVIRCFCWRFLIVSVRSSFESFSLKLAKKSDQWTTLVGKAWNYISEFSSSSCGLNWMFFFGSDLSVSLRLEFYLSNKLAWISFSSLQPVSCITFLSLNHNPSVFVQSLSLSFAIHKTQVLTLLFPWMILFASLDLYHVCTSTSFCKLVVLRSK